MLFPVRMLFPPAFFTNSPALSPKSLCPQPSAEALRTTVMWKHIHFCSTNYFYNKIIFKEIYCRKYVFLKILYNYTANLILC